MFTLTSTSTKLAVLALSAGLAVSTFTSVTLGFESSARQVTVIELPTVVVVGQRASVVNDTAQAAAKVTTKAAI